MALTIVTTALAMGASTAGAAPVTAATPWKAMTTPFVKSGVDDLWGVSCASTTSCVAVGQTGSATGANPPPPLHVLAEVWNGKAWRVTTTPNTVDRLVGVSCSSPTYCMAVSDSGLAELWNGSNWSITQSSSATGGFESVSCVTTDCLAVGYAAGGALPFAESWDGHTWTTVSPSVPPGEGAAFWGDSCSSVARCEVVGSAETVSNAQISALSESFNGTWTAQPLPNATPDTELLGVSCTQAASPVTCMGVGLGSTPTTPFGAGIADVWNGSTGTWTAAPPATPSLPAQGTWGLQSASCASPSWCIAAGSLSTSSSSSRPLAEAWNGSAWTVMNTAGLSALLTPARYFHSVSCPSATFCVAVGAKGLFNQTQPEAASWGTP